MSLDHIGFATRLYPSTIIIEEARNDTKLTYKSSKTPPLDLINTNQHSKATNKGGISRIRHEQL